MIFLEKRISRPLLSIAHALRYDFPLFTYYRVLSTNEYRYNPTQMHASYQFDLPEMEIDSFRYPVGGALS